MASESQDLSPDAVARRIVQAALDEVAPLLPPGAELSGEPAAPLAAPEGPLESLGLVNLVVALDNAATREGAPGLGFMQALAVPVENSPFRTVGALQSFVDTAMREGGS
jgi:hypothetical protein